MSDSPLSRFALRLQTLPTLDSLHFLRHAASTIRPVGTDSLTVRLTPLSQTPYFKGSLPSLGRFADATHSFSVDSPSWRFALCQKTLPHFDSLHLCRLSNPAAHSVSTDSQAVRLTPIGQILPNCGSLSGLRLATSTIHSHDTDSLTPRLAPR